MMVKRVKNSVVILCAACALLCSACSSGGSGQSPDFEVIQQKVTRGEPLTKEEQEAFDDLNKMKQGEKVQQGTPK
jgi:hypothetical protein